MSFVALPWWLLSAAHILKSLVCLAVTSALIHGWVKKRYVSNSKLLHLSFTLYWGTDVIWNSICAVAVIGYNPPLSIWLQWSFLFRTTVALPLIVYLIPFMWEKIGPPSEVEYNRCIIEMEKVRNREKDFIEKTDDRWKMLRRIVKRAVKKVESFESGLLSLVETAEVKERAKRLLAELKELQKQIAEQMPATAEPAEPDDNSVGVSNASCD